jgi:hypothetical protein
LTTWREKFELSAAQVPEKDELDIRYRFGNPASDAGINKVINTFGAAIPDELRSMLKEFDGISIMEKTWSEEWEPLYLSTAQMLHDVPEYLAHSGNPLPPNGQLSHIVFFAQQNGYADLYAICVSPFSRFEVGQVLALQHDSGMFALEQKSLLGFVSCPKYCTL